jgi:hypothetical protein
MDSSEEIARSGGKVSGDAECLRYQGKKERWALPHWIYGAESSKPTSLHPQLPRLSSACPASKIIYYLQLLNNSSFRTRKEERNWIGSNMMMDGVF